MIAREDHTQILHLQVVSVLLGFFAMGAIEMVGIASNYIKVGLHISDVKANLLPFLTYIWFMICTIPTGILMRYIGRKHAVILTMSIMLFSMVLGLLSTSYFNMILCFILLGIGNVSMQTAMYQLLSYLVVGDRLAQHLTVGQLVKTLSSFSAPYVAMLGAVYFGSFFDLGWRVLFLYYFLVISISILLLSFSSIRNVKEEQQTLHFFDCFRLLKNPFILLSFMGVIFHVGLDVCTNTLAPKILMYRCGDVIEKASFGASLYFIARLFGCLSWSFLLDRISRKAFFFISLSFILMAVIALFFVQSKILIYLCISLIGVGNANLFPVFFSQAVLSSPAHKSQLSTLMIMAQGGGAILPLLMGVAFDKIGLNGAVSILLLAGAYLLFYAFWFKIPPTKTGE